MKHITCYITRWVLLLAAVAAVPDAAEARPAQALPSAQTPFDRPPRIGIVTEVPLTLPAAIAMALANNNDIDVARAGMDVTGSQLTAARGAYDPLLALDAFVEDARTPVASLIGGAADASLTQRTTALTPRVSGHLPGTGGSYQLDLSAARQTTNSQFTTLNPQYPTAFAATFVQPLMRNLWIDDHRRRIQVARANQSIGREQFRQSVIEIVTRTANAYSDLVFAAGNLDVQVEALELARAQAESNQRQAEQGVLAPIDVIEARTQAAIFEQNVYAAQEALTAAENELKSLITPDRNDPLWPAALVPVSPLNLDAPPLVLEDAVAAALNERPELRQIERTLETNQTNTRYFRNQTAPEVDLTLSYRSSSLAGRFVEPEFNPLAGSAALMARVNELSLRAGLPDLETPSAGSPLVPDALIGGYRQSLSNLFRDFPTFQVGLQISLPLRNRTAAGNLAAARAEGRQIEDRRNQLALNVETEVRNAMQAVDSASRRLAAAASARQLAEEQYESELRQFQAGASTVFLLLQRQTEMIRSRVLELQAETGLSRAIANFHRSTARTLEAFRIDIQPELTAP